MVKGSTHSQVASMSQCRAQLNLLSPDLLPESFPDLIPHVDYIMKVWRELQVITKPLPNRHLMLEGERLVRPLRFEELIGFDQNWGMLLPQPVLGVKPPFHATGEEIHPVHSGEEFRL